MNDHASHLRTMTQHTQLYVFHSPTNALLIKLGKV